MTSASTLPSQKPVAIITGGSRGIGAGISKTLAKAGYHVAINFQSSADRARILLDEIEKEGGSGTLLPFSVKDALAIKEAFSNLHKETGRIDVLINNAGVTADGLLVRQKEEDFDAVLDTNLKGAMLCTKEAIAYMMKARSGNLVHISSIVGLTGNAGQSIYAASKAGLIGFSKSIAKEMAARGIRSNVIAPGFIKTEMTEVLTEKQKEDILRNIPLNQFGESSDVAELVCFLVSARAKYITGETISVTGGLSL